MPSAGTSSRATVVSRKAIPYPSNVTMMEGGWVNNPREPKVVKPFPTVVDGHALPLEGNGLGVEFDDAEAARIPFYGGTRPPRLRAADGSVRDH